eukprot:scaffold3612_cov395-Prasinococcus_capsulatus_cf.AAC.2
MVKTVLRKPNILGNAVDCEVLGADSCCHWRGALRELVTECCPPRRAREHAPETACAAGRTSDGGRKVAAAPPQPPEPHAGRDAGGSSHPGARGARRRLHVTHRTPPVAHCISSARPRSHACPAKFRTRMMIVSESCAPQLSLSLARSAPCGWGARARPGGGARTPRGNDACRPCVAARGGAAVRAPFTSGRGGAGRAARGRPAPGTPPPWGARTSATCWRRCCGKMRRRRPLGAPRPSLRYVFGLRTASLSLGLMHEGTGHAEWSPAVAARQPGP